MPEVQHFADLHEGEDCYDLSWIELKRRYGQPHIIALACEEQLLGFSKLDKDIPEKLNKLSILMKRCRFAMADETIASNLDSVQFLTTIVNKFYLDLKRKWVDCSAKIMTQSSRIASFINLADFIEEQARDANSVLGLKLFKQTLPKVEQSKINKISSFQTTTSSSKDSSCNYQMKCFYCSKGHKIYQCKEFHQLSLAEKWQMVRKHNLCKLCLNPGHFAHQCKSKIICKLRNCGSINHNSLLHRSNKNVHSSDCSLDEEYSNENNIIRNEATKIKSLAVVSKSSSGSGNSSVYLDIVPVKVVVKHSDVVLCVTRLWVR